MRRIFFPAVPLFVAGVVLVLASPVLRAQQEHDHASATSAGQACACCGKSGSEAMNHAAGGGCCGQMAMGQAAAAKPDAPAMNQGAGGGCCGNMAMGTGAAAKPDTPAMNQGAGGGCCSNMAMGTGEGSAMPMAGGDPSVMSDMQVFHYLFENRADIRRTVKILPNGIDTLTESDKPEVAAKLKTHVAAMYGRLKDGRPIHQRDPLFEELFAHADQIDANITYTDKGLRVIETSTDPAVAHLLHKHAEAVDGFIKNGMAEMMKDHPIN